MSNDDANDVQQNAHRVDRRMKLIDHADLAIPNGVAIFVPLSEGKLPSHGNLFPFMTLEALCER
ncbi:MAG: hypothetical protein FJ267_06210 [Planctomycetes bacterium]|nr:hypothetical protein [Planctomycetota bacterium]